MDYLQYRKVLSSLYKSYAKYVLNLIINGLPSIHYRKHHWPYGRCSSFKPYYKWITFNTMYVAEENGGLAGFKPYYKWITFNT